MNAGIAEQYVYVHDHAEAMREQAVRARQVREARSRRRRQRV